MAATEVMKIHSDVLILFVLLLKSTKSTFFQRLQSILFLELCTTTRTKAYWRHSVFHCEFIRWLLCQ